MTINNDTNTDNLTTEHDAQPRGTLIGIYILYNILMSFMGALTNMLTIATMGQPYFKKLPTSFFLIVLAVSDTLTSFSRIIPIINHAIRYDIRTTSSLACKIYYLFTRANTDTSNCMVVIISIERFFTVFCPHTMKSILTYHRAKVLSFLTILYASSLPFIFLFSTGGRNHIVKTKSGDLCVPVPAPEENYIILLLYFVMGIGLPVICISVCTISTILRLVYIKRKTVGNQGTSKGISNVNRMLLGVCAMFFITNGGLAVYWLIASAIYGYEPSYLNSWENTAYLLVSMLYTVNYTCNFWVYTLSGRTFRREVMKTIVQYDICPCLKSLRVVYPDSTNSAIT